jgi:hypothetical protein
MKKIFFPTVIIGFVFIFGLIFSGCKKHDPVFGTIKVQNNGHDINLIRVSIADVGNGKETILDSTVFTVGETRTYPNIQAAKSYFAIVIDQYNNSYKSAAFKLKADQTVTLSYNVTTLVVN